MWIKGEDLGVLTGRPLYIEESVIHKTVNLCRPRSVPCPTSPSVQDTLIWVMVKEEPAGSSHLVLAVTSLNYKV